MFYFLFPRVHFLLFSAGASHHGLHFFQLLINIGKKYDLSTQTMWTIWKAAHAHTCTRKLQGLRCKFNFQSSVASVQAQTGRWISHPPILFLWCKRLTSLNRHIRRLVCVSFNQDPPHNSQIWHRSHHKTCISADVMVDESAISAFWLLKFCEVTGPWWGFLN